MFRSIKFIGYGETRLYEFEITDSDFVTIRGMTGVMAQHWYAGIATVIAAEYVERNLLVAKNIVLYCLYMEEQGYKNIICYQDRYCPEYIDNWVEIAAERDRLLDKLYAMK